MTFEALSALVDRRWREAQVALGLRGAVLTWDIGPYKHFANARGYAVTFGDGGPVCHLRVSEKMLRAPVHRVDGVLRHEIGHVLDIVTPKKQLNAWARRRGVELPSTVERRADAIAQAVWRSPIRYDSDLVQNVSHGTPLRPRHLGL